MSDDGQSPLPEFVQRALKEKSEQLKHRARQEMELEEFRFHFRQELMDLLARPVDPISEEHFAASVVSVNTVAKLIDAVVSGTGTGDASAAVLRMFQRMCDMALARLAGIEKEVECNCELCRAGRGEA